MTSDKELLRETTVQSVARQSASELARRVQGPPLKEKRLKQSLREHERRQVSIRRTEYTEERPHSSLGYRTPKEVAAQTAAARASTALEWGKRHSNARHPLPTPIPDQHKH